MRKLLVVLAGVSALLTVAGCSAPGAYDEGPVAATHPYYYLDRDGRRQTDFYDPFTDTYRPLNDRVLE